MAPIVEIILWGVYVFVALWLTARLIIGKGRAALEPREPHPIEWDLVDVLLVIVLYMVLTQTCSLALSTMVERGTITRSLGLKLSIGCQAAVNLATVFYVFQVVFRVRQHSAGVLGLSTRQFFLNCGRGISGYIMYFPLIISSAALMTYIATSPWITRQLPTTITKMISRPQTSVVMLDESQSASFIAALTFFAVVIAPIAEEIFFRGFLQQAVRRRYGEYATIVITAVVFAAVHMNLRYVLPLTVLGILLSYLYERTGTLVAPIVVHALHNGTMVAGLIAKKILEGD